jgi:acyl-CoA synthetase (AMP-forming)/AMP-acid ligase II
MNKKNATCILTALEANAASMPDKAAFIYLRDGEEETSRISFECLLHSAAGLAPHLRAVCNAGERMVLAVPDGIDFIVLFLACLSTGVVAVPVKPPQNREASRKVLAIASNCDAAALVCDGSMVHRLASFFPEHAALARMRHVDVEALMAQAARSADEAAVRDALPFDPKAVAYLQYTSGSTGHPRGVMVSHSNVVANEAMIRRRWQSGPEDICLSWLPMFHDMGLIAAVLHVIYTGATGVLMPSMAFVQKPARWMAALHRYRATITGGPNFALCALCTPRSIETCRSLDLSSLRVVYCGSEPISCATAAAFLQAYAPMGLDSRAFGPGYGLAEATLMVSVGGMGAGPLLARRRDDGRFELVAYTGQPPELLRHGHVMGCGDLLQPQTVRIVDPATCTPCEDGSVGEVWLHGDHIAQGYWQNPQATADAFRASVDGEPGVPYLRTGDLGFLLDGELFITGRIKELMIFNGSNCYPQDVEEAVAGCHEALSLGRTAAFSLSHGDEEKLYVVQELNRDHARRLSYADRAQIVEKIRRAVYERLQLPVREVVPVRLNSIPRTTSGKICRVSCKRQYLDDTLERVGVEAADALSGRAA